MGSSVRAKKYFSRKECTAELSSDRRFKLAFDVTIGNVTFPSSVNFYVNFMSSSYLNSLVYEKVCRLREVVRNARLHPEDTIVGEGHFREKGRDRDESRDVRCVATFITGKSSGRSEVWPLISTCPTQPSMRPFTRCTSSVLLPPLSCASLSLSLSLSHCRPLHSAVHPVRFAPVKRGEN